MKPWGGWIDIIIGSKWLMQYDIAQYLVFFQIVLDSGAAPDMSILRLVKEHELHKNKLIGSGEFGTVYSVGTNFCSS